MKNLKVLLLNGSPHEKGCVFTALSEVVKGVHEYAAEIETEIFWIGNKPVPDCIACGSCGKTGKCALKDDVLAPFVEKMVGSDALIVGSPVYYAGPTGSICSLLDRAFFAGKAAFTGKPAACIVNCRRGGASAAFDRLNKFFTINQMPVVASSYWNDTHGSKPGDVQQDLEGLQTMRILGRNLAHLLKTRAAAALPPPPAEAKITTNFIKKA